MPEKVSDFTAIITPSTLDVMPLIDVDSTGDKRRKITIANLKTAVGSTGGGGGGSTGALAVLDTSNISSTSTGVATVDFALSTGYAEYEMRGWVVPATDSQLLYLQFDDGGGFDNTNEYDWVTTITRIGLTSDRGVAGDAGIGISSLDNGSGSNEGCSFTAKIRRAKDAVWTEVEFGGTSFHAPNSNHYTVNGAGHHEVSASIDSVRLVYASGNIAQGTLRLVGVP